MKPGLKYIARYLSLSTKFYSWLCTRIPASELRKLGDSTEPSFSINKVISVLKTIESKMLYLCPNFKLPNQRQRERGGKGGEGR